MITLGMKDYAIGGLAILLGLSLWANSSLLDKNQEAYSAASVAEAAERNAVAAAQQCNDNVERLEKDQRDREAAAQPAIVASVDGNKRQQAKAQVILTKPATVPGNDYQSAKDRMAMWLKERQK